ncbi:hypothetical protein [Mycobacteroides chelonae]
MGEQRQGRQYRVRIWVSGQQQQVQRALQHPGASVSRCSIMYRATCL